MFRKNVKRRVSRIVVRRERMFDKSGLASGFGQQVHSSIGDTMAWFLSLRTALCMLGCCCRDSELLVRAQGPRPDNILFLVHEVFEGLILESFHGVTYDYFIPCPECLRMVSC